MFKSICIFVWIFFAVMGAIGCIGGTIEDVKNGIHTITEAFKENVPKLLIAEVAIAVIMFVGYSLIVRNFR